MRTIHDVFERFNGGFIVSREDLISTVASYRLNIVPVPPLSHLPGDKGPTQVMEVDVFEICSRNRVVE